MQADTKAVLGQIALNSGGGHGRRERILIESKGYGATGSKMTDILGDIRTIIAAKRPDTALLFFTDGLTWKQRKSDLRKIVITRIYTYAMADQFEKDLRQLKSRIQVSVTSGPALAWPQANSSGSPSIACFSRKSEADIVFKAAAKVRAQLDQYFVQETKRIREHQDRVIAERLNGAK